MLWRLVARLLTGPVAFFTAGVIDLGAFVFVALRDAIRRRASASIAPTGSCGEREQPVT